MVSWNATASGPDRLFFSAWYALMKKIPGRLPSSAGGLYSLGPLFSRNVGYGSTTTSALGRRPNHFGAAVFARASAACEYAISSARLLKRYFGSVRSCCRSFGTSLVRNDRSAIVVISAFNESITRRPSAWTSLGGIVIEL